MKTEDCKLNNKVIIYLFYLLFILLKFMHILNIITFLHYMMRSTRRFLIQYQEMIEVTIIIYNKRKKKKKNID